MKVVIGSQHFGEQFVRELRDNFPDVTFVAAYNEEEQQREIRDAAVFFGWPSRETFLAAKRLQWIHCPGTGIDRIVSTPELVTSSVILTNARGPHTEPMADHVFALMLWLAHWGREIWEDQAARRWDTGKYEGRMIELGGRTMGIMALGGIGKAVARRAHGFGMEVYAVDAQPVQPPLASRPAYVVCSGNSLIISDTIANIVETFLAIYVVRRCEASSARPLSIKRRPSQAVW